MRILPALLLVLASAGSALANSEPAVPPEGTVILTDLVQTLRTHGDFDTFAQLSDVAGIVDVLRIGGPFTIFAPTDEAWEKIPSARLRTLRRPEHRAELRELLLYHVIPGEADTSKFSGTQTVISVEGYDIVIKASMTQVVVGGAELTIPDIKATNGVIHGIDAVLEVPLLPASRVVSD